MFYDLSGRRNYWKSFMISNRSLSKTPLLISSPPREFQGAILVYDITNRESFLELDEWRQRIMEFFPRICLLLIGNKVSVQATPIS
jgi:hypothetical protein